MAGGDWPADMLGNCEIIWINNFEQRQRVVFSAKLPILEVVQTKFFPIQLERGEGAQEQDTRTQRAGPEVRTLYQRSSLQHIDKPRKLLD